MAMDHGKQGSDVVLARNASTGKYDLVFSTSGPNKGNPVVDQSRTHAVLATLANWKRGTRPGAQAQEGGYFYDPQNRRGTLLWTVSQDRMATPSQLEAFAADGGQQLVDSKHIASFSVRARRVKPGQFRVDFAWTTPDGTRVPQQQLLLPLG